MATKTPKIPKLPTGLSPSSMDLYHQCGRRYEWEKVKGNWSMAGPEATLGTFVHKILEIVMQRPPEERTLENARLAAKEAWVKTSNGGEFKSHRLNVAAVKKFKWDAWHSVENYFAMEPPETVEVVATEQNLKTEVGGVPVRGIIDRLDRCEDKIVVSDYKNGKLPNPKYPDSKGTQLNMYAAMVESTTGERPEVGRLIFTAHSQIINVPFTDDSVAAVTEKIQTTWAAVKSDFEGSDYNEGTSAFRPNTGPLCGWCPVIEECPEGMAEMTMLHRRGRLKKTAPAYKAVSKKAGTVVRMPRRRS